MNIIAKISNSIRRRRRLAQNNAARRIGVRMMYADYLYRTTHHKHHYYAVYSQLRQQLDALSRKLAVIGAVVVLTLGAGCAARQPQAGYAVGAPIDLAAGVIDVAAKLSKQYPAEIYRSEQGGVSEYVVVTRGRVDGEFHRAATLDAARFVRDQYFIDWAQTLAVRPSRSLERIE